MTRPGAAASPTVAVRSSSSPFRLVCYVMLCCWDVVCLAGVEVVTTNFFGAVTGLLRPDLATVFDERAAASFIASSLTFSAASPARTSPILLIAFPMASMRFVLFLAVARSLANGHLDFSTSLLLVVFGFPFLPI